MAARAVLVLLVSLGLSWSFKEVCIISDGANQKPSIECVVSLTLNQFCEEAQNIISDDAVVTLFGGTHNLSMVCELAHVRNVTLKGESGSGVTVQCSSKGDSGFLCVNVSTLKISGIQLIGCGAYLNQPINPYDDFYAILVITGSDLTLTNVTISDSKNSGFCIFNVAGNVIVESSTFANLSSGGCVLYDSHSATSRVTVRDSVYLNNRLLHDPYDYTYLSGGLLLHLSNSNKTTVNISNVYFYQNKSRYFGGNMGILCDSSASVSVTDTTFVGGYSNEGGGLYAEQDVSFTNYCSVSITNATFSNNQALFAGGVLFCKNPQILLLHNTSFFGNSGVVSGIALQIEADVSPHRCATCPEGSVSISMCNFSNHYPDQSESPLGVIAFETLPYYVTIADITIESNNCTAILSTESDLIFSGSSKLANNTAVNGAGFRLIYSKLYFNPYTNLTVTGNTALSTGGGIQIENKYCTTNQCFYDWNPNRSINETLGKTVNFTVTNNHARDGGDNIFGNELYNCSRSLKLNFPHNEASHPSSVTSKPNLVCFDGYDDIGCPNPTNTYFESFKVYPGNKVTIFLRLVGQNFGAISGTVSASTVGAVAIRDDEKAQVVDMLGSNISYTIYSIRDNIKTGPHLILLQVEHSCPYYDPTPLQIDITFEDCPFGFSYTKVIKKASKFACQCNTSNSLLSSCSIQSQTLTKKLNFSWLGMFELEPNHTYLAGSKYCPFDYCDPSIVSVQSYLDGLDQDQQCQYNRTGILCGGCPEGWSLVLGSSECYEHCPDVWLLLLLPFSMAGLVLVLVILFLNLTVTMGTMSGLIFYVNILQDYSVELLSKHPIIGLTPLLQIFLSWLNLDLGVSTCFYNGMEAFGKAMLLFVFPTYIWLISAVVIFFSNRYILFTRLVGENAVKVLATLILLSYAKMLRVTIGALNFKFVEVYIDASTSLSKLMWVADGNIPYFDPQRHIALCVLAILLIVILLPFSVALLCIRHLYSLSNCGKMFSWIDNLKPFFDTYTGPFKDEARFWTGLLLFVRVFLLIVLVLDFKEKVTPFYIIVTVCLFLSAIMVTLQGVYKRNHFNILEYFFILNICTVFLINSHVGEGSNIWKSILTHLLVSSAFLAFLGIVVYHAYLKLSHTGWMQRCKFRSCKAEADNDEIPSFRDDRGYGSIKDDGDDGLVYSE